MYIVRYLKQTNRFQFAFFLLVTNIGILTIACLKSHDRECDAWVCFSRYNDCFREQTMNESIELAFIVSIRAQSYLFYLC